MLGKIRPSKFHKNSENFFKFLKNLELKVTNVKLEKDSQFVRN